jgi:thiamine-phosphate pyrophosphorylase
VTSDPTCRLYLITPPRLDAAAFSSLLAEALDAGDVAAVQLRLKNASDDDIRRACDALRPVAQSREVAFILNDRPDLAAAGGCDGVHVGQQDTPYAEARRIVGADAIVGVTCHNSRHLAIEAAEVGADYVAFGAFFATSTKDSGFRAEPEIIAWWSELMRVPCVAIGGITADNCAPLVQAGADFLAVCSGVWQHPEGPAAAVAQFHRALGAAGAPRSGGNAGPGAREVETTRRLSSVPPAVRNRS